MANYAKSNPIADKGGVMTDFPAPVTVQDQYVVENGVASSVISLQPQTSQIEVSTFGGQGAVIRWVPRTETAAVAPQGSVISSGLGANWTHHVPPGMWRQFVVPKETQGAPAGQIGSIHGLYQRVAIINAGISPSSILLAEF